MVAHHLQQNLNTGNINCQITQPLGRPRGKKKKRKLKAWQERLCICCCNWERVTSKKKKKKEFSFIYFLEINSYSGTGLEQCPFLKGKL